MRKIFFLTTFLLMMIMTTAAFAEEVTEQNVDAPYIYTSEDFKFSIACPIKPLAVVQNPWQEPERRGEMLVFANDGWNIQYAYMIQVNAFENENVPDFNTADKQIIDEYLNNLKEANGFGLAELVNITKENKGVYAVTADTIEVLNKDTGEVEGEFVADKQYVYTYFRTPEGRCVSVQLINDNLESKELLDTYRYSVATFKDNTAVKKSDKKSDKKSKNKKSKDKKDKKDKKSKSEDKK